MIFLGRFVIDKMNISKLNISLLRIMELLLRTIAKARQRLLKSNEQMDRNKPQSLTRLNIFKKNQFGVRFLTRSDQGPWSLIPMSILQVLTFGVFVVAERSVLKVSLFVGYM